MDNNEAQISKGTRRAMPITIFCPFTRRWTVDRWLENLSKVDHDPSETNLCVIIDIDEPYILNMIRNFASPYRSFYYKMNEQWQPNELKLGVRRARVAEVMNQAKDLVSRTDGEIVIGLEDDTVFDRLESFESLYKHLDDSVGFVEGVQVGRWGVNMIGAWKVDLIDNPRQIRTLLPSIGIQDISAGGLYGYAVKRELFLNHEFFTSTALPWGPDVNFGLWIRKQGLECLIDWSIVFGHQDHDSIAYPENRKLVEVSFTKNTNNGKWDRVDT